MTQAQVDSTQKRQDTQNYGPEDDIKPCIGIEEMKATVKYAEASDKAVACQILAIELSK